MKKVSHLPQGTGPRRQLRRAAVKLGAKTLPHLRPVFRLGPLLVERAGDGTLFLRWGKGRRRRLFAT